MPDGARARENNLLLGLLPSADAEAVLRYVSLAPLAVGVPLGEEIYFVLSGLVSTFVLTSGGQTLHTGLTGREGVLGLTGFGDRLPSIQTSVLAPGTAAKVSRSRFRDVWSNSSAIRELQLRYSELMMCCAQQSTACNALHDARSRLCTWLLRAHDRLPGERLPFTHELLAQMIGVRRTTATLCAHDLQKEGLLLYTRGRIRIVSRAGLENQACECYRITQRFADHAFPITATPELLRR